jgi:hypothetical protein
MLKCFVDDSGSDISKGGLLVLAGYLMEELRWEDFANKWDIQLKRTPSIEHFHMRDAEHGNGEFLGVDSVFRRMKVRDLALVIEQCKPTAIKVGLRWDDYVEIIKGNVLTDLDNPFAILFFQIMRAVSELQIRINEVIPDHLKKPDTATTIAIKPVEFIFDNHTDDKEEESITEAQCLQWYFQLRDKLEEPHRTMVGNTPRFLDDKDVVSLQAADMLAWHLRRDHEFPDEQRDILGMISTLGVWEKEVGVEDLKAIVKMLQVGSW